MLRFKALHQKSLFFFIVIILITAIQTCLIAQDNSIQSSSKNIIVTDGSGNSYIAGNFKSASLKFGKTVLKNNGQSDIFLAKYDSHSKLVWAKNIGGINDEKLESLVVDPSGNCKITASSFSKDINIAGSYFKPVERGIVFNAEINSSGQTASTKIEKIIAKNSHALQKSLPKLVAIQKTTTDTSITIISPAFGESLKVGTRKVIQWDAQNVEYVLIELSLDNGSTWQPISTTSGYDFTYDWVVPDTISSACLIRISDYDNPEIANTSEQFSIYGKMKWAIQKTDYNSMLQGIYTSASNTTWAVGYNGLMETTNKGATWKARLSGYCLFDVFFLNAKGWAVGLNGTIFHTLDYGETWFEIPSGYNFRFEKIYFTDDLVGYILGSGYLLKTFDGGETWKILQPSEHVIQNMCFLNRDTGWVAGGEGTILKTTDGGKSWSYQQFNGVQYGTLSSVFFINDQVGWACGSGLEIPGGVILKTEDGGTSWEVQQSGVNNFIYSVKFTDSQNGWAVGDEGIMFNTTDGGSNWIEEGSGTLSDLYAVTLFGNDDGWVTGNDGIVLKYKPDSNVPVELTNFSADINNSAVQLNWSTATETNNKGFEIERGLSPTPSQREGAINTAWQKIGFVEGKGTTTDLSNYTFIDNLESISYNGNVSYRIKQIDFDGTCTYSKVISVNIGSTINDYSLSQNYPNPFNPSTVINYSIKNNEHVILKIYNMIGQEVAILVNEVKQPGKYSVNFNAANLASGTYVYSLTAGKYSQVKKMILVK